MFFVERFERMLGLVDIIVILMLLAALVAHVVLMFLFLDNIGGTRYLNDGKLLTALAQA